MILSLEDAQQAEKDATDLAEDEGDALAAEEALQAVPKCEECGTSLGSEEALDELLRWRDEWMASVPQTLSQKWDEEAEAQTLARQQEQEQAQQEGGEEQQQELEPEEEQQIDGEEQQLLEEEGGDEQYQQEQ